jgi:hypothetical protein
VANRAALLAQDSAGRFDRVTLGCHVVNERHDQRSWGSTTRCPTVYAAASSARADCAAPVAGVDLDVAEVNPKAPLRTVCA